MARTLARRLASLGKHSKFRNTPVVVDGVRFASKLEAKRWQELRLLERAGKITDLQRQPRYPIEVSGHHISVYYGDFSYVEGRVLRVCEDTKGFQTDEFKLKWKLVTALYPYVQFRLYPPRAT